MRFTQFTKTTLLGVAALLMSLVVSVAIAFAQTPATSQAESPTPKFNYLKNK